MSRMHASTAASCGVQMYAFGTNIKRDDILGRSIHQRCLAHPLFRMYVASTPRREGWLQLTAQDGAPLRPGILLLPGQADGKLPVLLVNCAFLSAGVCLLPKQADGKPPVLLVDGYNVLNARLLQEGRAVRGHDDDIANLGIGARLPCELLPLQ